MHPTTRPRPRLTRLAPLALSLLACRPAAPDAFDGSVELFFRPEVGDKYFTCQDAYAFGKAVVSPGDLRFFVFDVRLVTADGTEHAVELADDPPFQQDGYALLDFEDAMSGCSFGTPALNKTIKGALTDLQGETAASFTGVRFRLGVPPGVGVPPTLESAGLWRPFFAAYGSAGNVVVLNAQSCDAGCQSAGQPEIALDEFDLRSSEIIVDWGVLVDPTSLATCDPGAACGCDAPCVPGLGIPWTAAEGSNQPAVFRVE